MKKKHVVLTVGVEEGSGDDFSSAEKDTALSNSAAEWIHMPSRQNVARVMLQIM